MAVTSAIPDERRGIKRKAGNLESIPARLHGLAITITEGLAETVPDDCIQACGLSCVAIMESRPEEVLDLAHQKLHTWPFKDVATCWRRMYEEASLWSVAAVLRSQADAKSWPADCESETGDHVWSTTIVKTLDTALYLTGAPGRSRLFETVFDKLNDLAPLPTDSGILASFSIAPPGELRTQHRIPRDSSPLDFEQFQAHLDKSNTPIIIQGALNHWPAQKKWVSPAYWMERTLGGRRLVPVEVGSQYTDDEWSQKVLSFRDFLSTYMLSSAKKTGYLAQYDLFAQIPALRSDIQTPDYCYCNPPSPDRSLSTSGGVEVTAEVDEPLMNLWLGPAGTKTPLHTDPYSNILAQVMGYKYIRLYSPTETSKLYPMGVDEKGVDMSNTSSIDIGLTRLQPPVKAVDLKALNEQRTRYPEFESAKFVEAILGPGECLYIPQGWWHYVEGLTIGASVSFWWN